MHLQISTEDVVQIDGKPFLPVKKAAEALAFSIT